MPLSLRRGRITAIAEQHDELVRLEVDGVPCIAYPRVTGPVEIGDDVLVNVQARALELGSGGFDILHANLTRGLELDPEPGAHVITLPYTSLQHAVSHVEETGTLAESLGGMPVVCCSVHSQLAPVCAALAGLRVAYVQLGGGALPVALSDAVRALRERNLLEFVVAAGPCLDADAQAVNVYSALAWCSARGIAAAQAVNATAALGGRAVLAPRLSGADERARHRGHSHHTEAVLRLCLAQPLVPEELDVAGWREATAGLPLSHMGRGRDEDPEFFAAAFAAGRLARSLLS